MKIKTHDLFIIMILKLAFPCKKEEGEGDDEAKSGGEFVAMGGCESRRQSTKK